MVSGHYPQEQRNHAHLCRQDQRPQYAHKPVWVDRGRASQVGTHHYLERVPLECVLPSELPDHDKYHQEKHSAHRHAG